MRVTQIRGNTDVVVKIRTERGKIRRKEGKYGQHYKIQITVEKVRALGSLYNPRNVGPIRVNTDRAKLRGI